MYRRLVILSAIIVAALCGLTMLGYHAVQRWSEGLQWKRLGEFAEVAEQIRQDVDRKLDEFIQLEMERPYTHYQDYYVPDNVAAGQQQMPLLASPLRGRMERGFAYGYFQVEPDSQIVTANDSILQMEGATKNNRAISDLTERNRANVRYNLLPILRGVKESTREKTTELPPPKQEPEVFEEVKTVKDKRQQKKSRKASTDQRLRRDAEDYYTIDSLQKQDRKPQVLAQQRSVYVGNVSRAGPQREAVAYDRIQAEASTGAEQSAEKEPSDEKGSFAYRQMAETEQESLPARAERAHSPPARRARMPAGGAAEPQPAQVDEQTQLYFETAKQADKLAETQVNDDLPVQLSRPNEVYSDARDLNFGLDPTDRQLLSQEAQSEMVQVRQGPFEPIVANGGDAEKSAFGKQIFLVREVQIEGRRFRQGFRLNEKKLIEEVNESAARFIRDGMSFELPQTKEGRTENSNVAYTAVLDFGFGYLIVYLRETVLQAIFKQATQLRNWYFTIVAVVFLAVMLGLLSLWRYAQAQVKLAEKKDDFISAVSHELRTPLTSIRMYSEMLEKDWVKSQDKRGEYYRNMRQESERLSRLIENVLDFSRIQKGRKRYSFNVGDLNDCVMNVVEMMSPYAEQNGFSIKTELEQLGQTTFDNDAVKQIVVNLLDNAIKYARNAQDRTITVRTRGDNQFILIEVEDHGPGVPHRQRQKIFEEFYRLGSEATRETAGTGLGLALVKKFAEAHNGFVEILNAKPAGAIFRVALAVQG
ncbi:MAG: sensor histidine kinase [Planctomycetota bacterium]|jgi:signal transduction histidine kinase